jgi:hypothetical protein
MFPVPFAAAKNRSSETYLDHRGIAMRPAWKLLALGLLLAVGSTVWIPVAKGEDFRIETKVYSGKSKQPVCINTTLFRAGHVYDFMSDPERIAVFDPAHGRFVLLDPARKLKAEVKTEEIQEFVERLQSVAAQSSNSITRFAANPQFDVQFDEDGKLELTSPQIVYTLKTQPAKSPEAADQYREFSDWYTRFNSLANPGSTPPFARLVVNDELYKRSLVPTEVHKTVGSAIARTEHLVSWRLLQRDNQRIAETANQLTTFKLVNFDDFQLPPTGKK